MKLLQVTNTYGGKITTVPRLISEQILQRITTDYECTHQMHGTV